MSMIRRFLDRVFGDPVAYALADAARALAAGRPAEAEDRARSGLTHALNRGDGPRAGALRAFLASALYRQGRYSEAAEPAALALEDARTRTEADPTALVHALHLSAALSRRRAAFDDAEALLREAVDALKDGPADTRLVHARTLNNLGRLFIDAGAYDRAGSALGAALGVIAAAVGADAPEAAPVHLNLAVLRLQEGDTAAAWDAFAEAERVRDGADAQTAYAAMVIEAALHERGGAAALASARYERAAEAWVQAAGAGHPDALYAHAGIARQRFAQGRAGAAEALDRALAASAAAGPVDRPEHIALLSWRPGEAAPGA